MSAVRQYPEPRPLMRDMVPYIECAIAGMKQSKTDEEYRLYDQKLADIFLYMLGGEPIADVFSDEEIEPFLVTEYDRDLHKAMKRDRGPRQGYLSRLTPLPDPDDTPTPLSMRPDAPDDAPKPRSMRKPRKPG